MRVVSVLVLSVFLTTAHAQAGSKIVSEKYHYYPVKGVSAEELKQEMNRLGPLNPPLPNRDPSWGYTERIYENKKVCAKFRITNNYHLPEWINPKEGSVLLRLDWARMHLSLRLHEKGHGWINSYAARKYVLGKCRNWMSINNRRIKASNIYDRITDHGFWTGVFLFNAR